MCAPKIKPIGKFLGFLLPSGYIAITLAPFGIYIKGNYYDALTKSYASGYENSLTNIQLYQDNSVVRQLVNHEKIHWQQQVEMGIILFYLWYVTEWLLKGLNYYKISFEQEAYLHDDDEVYLKSRKLYAWFKFIKSN